MTQLISEIWEGLCSAGLTEVMLYLPDNSAARCHWRDTAVIAGVRVALIADQERKIVRIVPVDSCAGIGVASPKGVDPTGHRSFVLNKIVNQFPQPTDPFAVAAEAPEPEHHPAPSEVPAATSHAEPPPPPPAPPTAPEPEPPVVPPPIAPAAPGRLGAMTRGLESKAPAPAAAAESSAGQGVPRPGERGWKRA